MKKFQKLEVGAPKGASTTICELDPLGKAPLKYKVVKITTGKAKVELPKEPRGRKGDDEFLEL